MAGILTTMSAFGQRQMTLQECLRIAFDQSYTARSAREQLRASEASAQAARRALFSTVDLTFEAPSYDRTLQSQINPDTKLKFFVPLENLQWGGSLNIRQPLIWTNSTVTLSGQVYRWDQRSDDFFSRDFFSNMVIELSQPLLVPNMQRINYRRAELDFEEAKSEYRRATLDLRYSVTEAFYRTYSTQEQLRIQRDRVSQQEESYTTAMRKYRSGLIAEVDALQFEVDLAAARNDLLSAENSSISRSNNFKLLIGLPLADSVALALTDTTFQAITIPVENAISEAKKTRVDLQRAVNNIERGTLSLEEVDGQRAIRGDLTMRYGLNNDDKILKNLFSNYRDTRGAVLRVTVPIFDWGRHAQDVEAAEARLRAAEYTARNVELTIEQEITDLVRGISSAAERVRVLFKSRLVAEQAYDINTRRYDVGTIGSIELSQSQTRLLQARLSALDALIDYNVALADITRRTAFDFRLRAPVGSDE